MGKEFIMQVFESRPDGQYVATAPFSADEALCLAQEIVRQRFERGAPMASPEVTKQYLCLQLADRAYEVFGVLFLDAQHRLLANEELFRGTIDATVVYPRIIVQRSLALNAAALILYHNHPSGEPTPSSADRHITERVKQALDLVEIRLLDHLVVAGSATASFAERGWV
jgi:DNA repair protein RadC